MKTTNAPAITSSTNPNIGAPALMNACREGRRVKSLSINMARRIVTCLVTTQAIYEGFSACISAGLCRKACRNIFADGHRGGEPRAFDAKEGDEIWHGVTVDDKIALMFAGAVQFWSNAGVVGLKGAVRQPR